MKKIFIAIATLNLCACYYTVPANDLYYEETYTIPEATYYSAPAYTESYVTTSATTTYVTPAASSSVIYVEQSSPDIVYVNSAPDIVYYNNPLLPPPAYDLPYRSHHVGTPPRKHIARPLPPKHHGHGKPIKISKPGKSDRHPHYDKSEGRPSKPVNIKPGKGKKH